MFNFTKKNLGYFYITRKEYPWEETSFLVIFHTYFNISVLQPSSGTRLDDEMKMGVVVWTEFLYKGSFQNIDKCLYNGLK